MDSLFLMQRYWGSDDENEQDGGNSSNDLSVSASKSKLDASITDIEHKDTALCNEKHDTNFPVKLGKKRLCNQELAHSFRETDNEGKKSDNLENTENKNDSSMTDHNYNVSKKRKKNKLEKIQDKEKNEIEENHLSAQNSSLQQMGNVESFPTIGEVYNQKDVGVKYALPYWLCNPTHISVNLLEDEIPISELDYLNSNTKKNLRKAGIDFLFPVQLAVIPWLMQVKKKSLFVRPSDICVSAPTGSGKTLAFVLPIVQSLKDRVVCAIRALIVLPVAELAIQVYKVFVKFIRGTDLKIALLTGKKSFIAEQNILIKANGEKFENLVDIVITTPGRLHDHIYRTRGFCLRSLRYLVIDEADRMMEEIQQGWLKEVEDTVFRDCVFPNCVCSSKPKFVEPSSAFNFGFLSHPFQKLLFSATLTHDPEQLHSLSLYKPKLFSATSVSSEQEFRSTCSVPSGLSMLQVISEESTKPMVICQLIKCYNFKKTLCFTETVERAHRLHLVLEEMGLLQVREISSFNRAIQRKIVLEQFSSGKVDILICSDLVARGIDIEDVDCVISYDVPQFIKIYIHRIGRTARAGKTGTAITLLSNDELPHFKQILTTAGIELPEKIDISSEDLKPLVDTFKKALAITEVKLKNEKRKVPRKPGKKDKNQIM